MAAAASKLQAQKRLPNASHPPACPRTYPHSRAPARPLSHTPALPAHTHTHLPPRSVDQRKLQIQIPLPARLDPSVSMMTVEDKPEITYRWVCACGGGG